ncbi:MAG: hypothetical protein O3A46_13395, partial [Candidatus Poribacteria bacterium]|nr:hypothetical protein [Candidatus Poribacteria bacterium]
PSDPPCHTFLDGIGNGQKPDHLCDYNARISVERFAISYLSELVDLPSEHLAGAAFGWSCELPEQYKTWTGTFPLPIGSRSVQAWRETGDPLGWHIANTSPEGTPEPVRNGLILCHEPDAWLGAVLTRRVDGGTVRLLGLVEVRDTLSDRTFQELDEATFEELKGRAFLAWGTPIILQEGADAEMRTVADRLTKWYQGTLLGQRVGGGRPRGTGALATADAFLKVVATARDGVLQNGDSVTQDTIAAYIQRHRLTVPTTWKVTDRTLRKWLKDFGYANWDEVLANLPDEPRPT